MNKKSAGTEHRGGGTIFAPEAQTGAIIYQTEQLSFAYLQYFLIPNILIAGSRIAPNKV